MQKDTIFTPTCLVPKLFYSKKCVNYDKVFFSTKLRKKPKRPKKCKHSHKVTKSCKKTHIKAQNCQKCWRKKRKIATLLTFAAKQRKIWQNFTPTLLARWYVYTSLLCRVIVGWFWAPGHSWMRESWKICQKYPCMVSVIAQRPDGSQRCNCKDKWHSYLFV